MQMTKDRWLPAAIMAIALCPAPVFAETLGQPSRMADLLVASAATLTQTAPRFESMAYLALSFAGVITLMDRFNLAQARSRTMALAIGSVDLHFSASRDYHGGDDAIGTDRWSMKGVGAAAQIPLTASLDLIIGGDFARMSRRRQIVDVNPHRLSTRMARAGMALAFGDDSRISLDYLSIARSARQDDLTRLTETIGGAPLTGHGPELAFARNSQTGRGSVDWRVSLGAMQRPGIDLGLADQMDLRTDARALASLCFHL